jgi:hypothetical protein
MRDPELVARAQRAVTRLEAAWERWRAAQGLAETQAQPVVGYVGYALKEPWGQPRAVIGFSADEAERLAAYLEHSIAARPVTVPRPSSEPQPTARGTNAVPGLVPGHDRVAGRSLRAGHEVPSRVTGSSKELTLELWGRDGHRPCPTVVWVRDGQAPARAQTYA